MRYVDTVSHITEFRSSADALLGMLRALDIGAMSEDQVAELLRDVLLVIDQMTAETVPLAQAVDDRRAYERFGAVSLTGFLSAWCNRTPGRAADLTRVQRIAREHPEFVGDARSGDIGWDHATVISRTLDRLDPDDAVKAAPIMRAEARRATPVEVRRLGEHVRYVADPIRCRTDERRQHAARSLAIYQATDGNWRIDGWLGPAGGLCVKTAIEAGARPRGSADERSAGQRRADALAELCGRGLDAGTAGIRHETRPHVNLLVQADTSVDSMNRNAAGADDAEPVRTGFNTVLSTDAAAGFLCDAGVSRVTVDGNGGAPLDVGRRERVVTPAIRRALDARDRGCRWPSCDRPAVWCTPHHIRFFSVGGRTSVGNLVLLCWVHHQSFVHARGWRIEGDPADELTFVSPDAATRLTSVPPARRRPGNPPPPKAA